MASFIEQKGEKTSPRGGGLFSLLSLNITNVIAPLLESVRFGLATQLLWKRVFSLHLVESLHLTISIFIVSFGYEIAYPPQWYAHSETGIYYSL